MALTIVSTIFVIGLLVLVHELGHFVTAKLTGMRVDEFAIGFGPKLFSLRRGETIYSLRAVPLGGFNDIAGMNKDDNEAGERGYCEKPVLSRMIVILAGSLMNFVLPVVLFFGIFFFSGIDTPNPEPVFGTVLADKPAALAGVKDGDRVLAVNGIPVSSWQEFTQVIQQEALPEGTGEPQSVNLSLERGSEKLQVTVQPTYEKQTQRAVVGVMSSLNHRDVGLIESAQLALQKTGTIIVMMLGALYNLLLELSGTELAGPIGIARMAGEVAQMGIVPLLNFAAFLSLNLGIINLFPLPALDGGHFVTLCVEAVRGKPLSSEALRNIQKVGVALLVLLMLLATANDIMRLFTGG